MRSGGPIIHIYQPSTNEHTHQQLAVGDMTMSGWKPTISLIHPSIHQRTSHIAVWPGKVRRICNDAEFKTSGAFSTCLGGPQTGSLRHRQNSSHRQPTPPTPTPTSTSQAYTNITINLCCRWCRQETSKWFSPVWLWLAELMKSKLGLSSVCRLYRIYFWTPCVNFFPRSYWLLWIICKKQSFSSLCYLKIKNCKILSFECLLIFFLCTFFGGGGGIYHDIQWGIIKYAISWKWRVVERNGPTFGMGGRI